MDFMGWGGGVQVGRTGRTLIRGTRSRTRRLLFFLSFLYLLSCLFSLLLVTYTHQPLFFPSDDLPTPLFSCMDATKEPGSPLLLLFSPYSLFGVMVHGPTARETSFTKSRSCTSLLYLRLETLRTQQPKLDATTPNSPQGDDGRLLPSSDPPAPRRPSSDSVSRKDCSSSVGEGRASRIWEKEKREKEMIVRERMKIALGKKEVVRV